LIVSRLYKLLLVFYLKLNYFLNSSIYFLNKALNIKIIILLYKLVTIKYIKISKVDFLILLKDLKKKTSINALVIIVYKKKYITTKIYIKKIKINFSNILVITQ
jgi:hypothetical protein